MSTFPFPAAIGFLLIAVARASAETPENAQREIAELRADVARHDAAYHRDDAPEITDEAYDLLKRRLVALERRFPEGARNAPPRAEIGDDRSGLFQTYRHRERMLSLEKVHTEAELRTFDARIAKSHGRDDLAYVVEPKFDGLAVSVTFENGKLVRAVTRGNGREGDDVTANVLQIAQLPRALRRASTDGKAVPIPKWIELRAEVFVPPAEFARVNAEREARSEPRFATPRNLAAGTLRQLDAQEVGRRGLQIVFFGLGACEPRKAAPATQRELHARVKAWGLPGIEESWFARSADELVLAVETCREARSRFGFPTDGAVVKVDARSLQQELGESEGSPRWAVAFKFPPDRAETEVLAITIQVGRTGALTPVAELAPIRLGGSLVARATLHNRDEIARKDIRVGDRVMIEKAGEIIPAVVAVKPEHRRASSRPFAFPATCPECHAAVEGRNGEATVRCVNAACPAQLRRRIEHFASKACVQIEGLGPSMIAALVETERVREIPDIYRLGRDDLLALGKNTARSTDQLLAAIDASSHAELWRFIHGLGIPQVGATASRELARHFGSLEALLAAAVDGIPAGEKRARKTASGGRSEPAIRAALGFFSDERNRQLVVELIAAGVQPTAPSPLSASGDSVIAGKTFVLTGTLPHLTRAQATSRIETAGGRVASQVSRATQFVVVGDDPGAKLTQAKTLGIPIIDEAELLRMLEGLETFNHR